MLINVVKKEQVRESYLRFVDPEEVKNVVRLCDSMRSHHRTHKQGYSDDKEMRDSAMIPHSVYWHPDYKHIFHNPDRFESTRLRRKFFRENWRLSTVDKQRG